MELPLLVSFATLGFVAVFAYINARVTQRQLKDGPFKRSPLRAMPEHWKSPMRTTFK
ncbi:MAG: hypothetical protein AAFR53_11390 [Pseudomonadota bacterium]